MLKAKLSLFQEATPSQQLNIPQTTKRLNPYCTILSRAMKSNKTERELVKSQSTELNSQSMPETENEFARSTKPSMTMTPLERKALLGLAKKVRGFKLTESKVTYDIDPQGNRVVKSEMETIKEVAPDLSAIIFTLTNLNKPTWQTKPSAEHEELSTQMNMQKHEAEIDLSQLSDSALREIAKLLPTGDI